MTSRIFRYEVPVDDRWHVIKCGPPLHVACRRLDVVEFWAFPVEDDAPVDLHHFRVYGTGHEMPDELVYVGTALTPDRTLVWHLMSNPWKVPT